MSTLTPMEQERLLELLADRAIGELSPGDTAELDSLLVRADGEPGYEELIGGLVLAADDPSEGEIPESLRSDLQRRGEGMVAGAPLARIEPQSTSGGWVGWTVAAAAVLLAAIGWLRPPTAPMVPVGPSPAERLAALETEPDTVVIPLEGQGELEAAGRAGELVWNERLQEGFLRLSALPSNDPSDLQYQLWIFDETRETYAVDGGVFNVSLPPTGEAVVPFEPKLSVGRAAAFAVTKERPGGVVVTDQSGLVLLGPVPGDG